MTVRLIVFLIILLQTLIAQTAIVSVDGDIEPGIYKYLKRAVSDALSKEPERVLFVINTFGGELNTTFQIVELFSGLDIPTITLVNEKAISAGTLIAMASQRIYMQSNSIMGDVAPITMGAEGPKMLGEKFQSPLRAKFRALAQKNGYPVKLSEAFVSTDKEIIQIKWKDGSKSVIDAVEYGDLSEEEKKNIVTKRTLVAKGELLTMSDREAIDFGFSSGTVNSPKSLVLLLAKQENTSSEIFWIEKTQAEKFFSTFLKYSWFLILIGLGGIYLEVKNPGFGFYGFVAIFALIAFFVGQYLVELANYWELILLIVGFVLLGIEILILPGFGIFGALGIALLLVSLVLMRQNFVIPEDVFEWDLFARNLELVLYVFLGSLVFLVLSFVLGSRFMVRSPLVFNKKLFGRSSKVVGPEREKNQIIYSSKKTEREKESLIGYYGKAITKLFPSGKVEILDKVYDAVVQNDYLDVGEEIVVVGVDGYLLVVEKKN